MKLNRLKSIANQVIRTSIRTTEKYMIDPFEHYTPGDEIIIDLKNKEFHTVRENDDVEIYYSLIIEWFHNALLKENIPLDIIESAIIKITPEKKECLIQAKGRIFSSKLSY